MNQIIYYDFADMNYASFFLTGLLQNEENFHYKLVVSKMAPPLLYHPAMYFDSGRRDLSSICLFKLKLFDNEFYFCIDARDSCEANPRGGRGYHLTLLKRVNYYFKVNYNDEAIRCDPNLSARSNKIIPVPLFFPVKMPELPPFRPRLIPCRAAGWRWQSAARRVDTLKNLIPLEEIRQLRNVKKDLDLFFVMGFYGEKSHVVEDELRYRIMTEIRKSPNVVSVVGFAASKAPPGKFAEFQANGYTLSEYLRCLASAKVGLYVRGVHNCLSFKLGQLLALGMPIVGQTLHNNKALFYNEKYFDDQFAFDEPKEIVKQALILLRDPERLNVLSKSNSSTFDAKFTPQKITSDILERLFNGNDIRQRRSRHRRRLPNNRGNFRGTV